MGTPLIYSSGVAIFLSNLRVQSSYKTRDVTAGPTLLSRQHSDRCVLIRKY